MWQNPYLNPWGMSTTPVPMGPQRQVLRANGRESAKEIRLGPGESALVLDATEPILYLCTADSMGAVSVTEYTLTERKSEPDRLTRLEQMVGEIVEKLNNG